MPPVIDLLDDDTMVLIRNAADALRRGELVVFPTETVYGLGADAKNPEAVRKVFEAKGRPADHPVIVHLAEFGQLAEWCRELPPSAELLAELFWPGPLTLVLKKAVHVLPEVTGGQDTVAVRIPSHPVAHALLKEFGSGVVAPSANKFGRLSPTTAADVLEDFPDEFAFVLDGGPCEIGIESTIVDLTSPIPRILRPGMILEESILVALDTALERVGAVPERSVSSSPDPKTETTSCSDGAARHIASALSGTPPPVGIAVVSAAPVGPARQSGPASAADPATSVGSAQQSGPASAADPATSVGSALQSGPASAADPATSVGSAQHSGPASAADPATSVGSAQQSGPASAAGPAAPLGSAQQPGPASAADPATPGDSARQPGSVSPADFATPGGSAQVTGSASPADPAASVGSAQQPNSAAPGSSPLQSASAQAASFQPDDACNNPETQKDGSPREAAVSDSTPRVPGSLESHYAPRTKVKLVNSADINKFIDEVEAQGYATAVLSFKPPAMLHRHWITAKSFPSHYAHTLYRNLRKLDAANADIIIIEEPPLTSDWTGIWDRIRRAASETKKTTGSEKENGNGA